MTGLVSLTRFAQGLMADVRAHREGKLTTREARARAMLAREALRAVHLELEGRKFIAMGAKDVGGVSLPAPRKGGRDARGPG